MSNSPLIVKRKADAAGPRGLFSEWSLKQMHDVKVNDDAALCPWFDTMLVKWH
jgi:hypothetical protein